MAYIADLDPQWHDPALDIPIHCVGCGVHATVEDMDKVTETVTGNGTGYVCPWCGIVNWDEEA